MDLAAQQVIVQHCIVHEETGTRPLSLEDGQEMARCGLVVQKQRQMGMEVLTAGK